MKTKAKKIDSILDEPKKLSTAMLKRVVEAKVAFDHAKEEVTLTQVAYVRAMRAALSSVDAPEDWTIDRDGTVSPPKKDAPG